MFPVGGADGDEVVVGEEEFLGNFPDLVVFLGGDGKVGGGDGEEAVQQSDLLLVGGELVELARDQEILGAAEQPALGLGHLHHDERLLLRQPAVLHHDALHGAGFFRADVEVGVGHAAEVVGKDGDVAGARGLHPVEGGDNLADGLGLRRCRLLRALGLRLLCQSEEFPDGHNSLPAVQAEIIAVSASGRGKRERGRRAGAGGTAGSAGARGGWWG